jgi:release factor glutamine methyltransferase
LRDAQSSLAKFVDSDDAKWEAQLLLQDVLKVNRAWLISHQNDALQPNIHAAYRALINRRVNGEPIAYILGYREFYGLNLKVTPDTLIPRPDTETLVEAALEKIPLDPLFRRKSESSVVELLNKKTLDSDFRRNDNFSILDLGTGTGAIALAIAKHRPLTEVTGVDASESALKIAQENAQNLQIANVQFMLSNWFDALKNQRFDVVVSNPPYIAEGDKHLSSGDLPWEPYSALVPGQSFSLEDKNAEKEDGLSAIKYIISDAPNYLKPHGWLMLEHGYDQAEHVADLLAQAGFSKIETQKDLGGNNRVTLGMMPR